MKETVHATANQISAFLRRDLAPEDLITVADHLAACDSCRALATVAGAERRLEEALAKEDHLTFDELEELAHGAEVPDHIHHCATCAEELRDLRSFRASLAHRPVRTPLMMTRGWAAAAGIAAAMVLIVFVSRMQVTQQPMPAHIVASLKDGGATIGLGFAGNVTGMPEADVDDLRDISRAMEAGDLPHARVLDSLVKGREVLLSGTPAEQARLQPVSPVGTTVLSDRPRFSWKAADGARWYKVAVYGPDFEPVAASGELHSAEWTPDKTLPREKALTWTVTAALPSGNVTAPRAPEPEAKFQVIAAEDEARMRAVIARTPHSDLLVMIRANELGLKDEARKAAESLAAANPGSPLAARLLETARSNH